MLLRYIKCAKTIRFIILKLPVEKQKKTHKIHMREKYSCPISLDSKLKNKRQTNKKNSKKQKQLFKI